jgi:hypothetical protein
VGKTRPKLNEKTLFVFSDPGGAKPLLSLAEENNLTDVLVVSDRSYSFYKDFKTKVKIIDKDIDTIISFFQPSLIFTGTSYTSDIEKKFIYAASEKKIDCCSFVDHWTDISKRFETEPGKFIIPDKIWVVDERAKIMAVGQGIEEQKIVISGNPYHDWLRKWKPEMNKNQFKTEACLLISQQQIIVYAPDPLSNVNGIEVYGFDELSATSLLVEFFNKHRSELANWIVLVKVHPNQNHDMLEKIISLSSSFHLLPHDIDTNTTIYYADVVMGFFSSFLIEADIMNKRVLRFFDKPAINDPIRELQIGVEVNITSLLKELKKINGIK